MSAQLGAKPAGLSGGAAFRVARQALAALLLLAQALALIHLGAVPHVIDPATGKVVHASPEHPEDAPPSPEPLRQSEECAVYTALTQAVTASSGSAVPLLLPSSTGYALPPARPTVAWRRELHRLSPSHSPPVAA
jgi:hypothetical protein